MFSENSFPRESNTFFLINPENKKSAVQNISTTEIAVFTVYIQLKTKT